MRHLENQILESGRFDGTIMYSPDGESLGHDQLKILVNTEKVIVFHPQMLGAGETLKLIESRYRGGRITHIYLLDSYFFCRRSYNHIDVETHPCLRCVGTNKAREADRMGCAPWPKATAEAGDFAAGLQKFAENGALSFYAQTETQRGLAREHFGETTSIEVVGLWCADWLEHFENFESGNVSKGTEGPFDVVYHGSRDLAKGLGWALSVAAALPQFKFLVPLDRGEATFSGPDNATIKPLRWDEGLASAIQGAKVTLVPSLWSAPCEGALVKSIITAPATAAVRNDTAFASEIPDDVLLKLPPDPKTAAVTLNRAIVDGWKPDANARRVWAANFKQANLGLLDRLLK